MPNQRFSIGESCALLDIDRVTLMRWMETEAIHPSTDARDKRYKYLTREQLLTLARAHDRTIRDESTIGPRLTGLQREILARLQALEEALAELRRTSRPYSAPEARQPAVPVADYTPYIPPVESQYSTAGGVYPSPLRGKRGSALQPGEWRTLPPIPDGWRPPAEVARMVGVPERTFKHQLAPRFTGDPERSGSIPYHTGRWRYPHPGSFATELLDPEQQDVARRVFGVSPSAPEPE